MLDFLRNLTKSDQEKRQEFISAYLDDSLSLKDKQHFEKLLENDEALRADLEQQRIVKEALTNLPRIRAPRNFVLDPSLYGRPSLQRGLQLYPALRVATVLAMFVFIALISVDVLVPESSAVSDIASAVQMELEEEKSAEEIGALAFEVARDGEQSDRSALREEPAAAAPVAEQAVEEDIELEAEDVAAEDAAVEEAAAEEAVSESENMTSPVEESETSMVQEAAPAVGEPAAEREGDADFFAPADDESDLRDRAVIETRIAESLAGQRLSGTLSPGDSILGGALETAAAETVESEATSLPAAATMTQLAIPEATQTAAEAIVALESPPADQTYDMGLDQEQIEDTATEAQLEVDDSSFLGIGSLRLAEICLGLSVLFLLLITLLLRRRLRRGT